MRIERENAATTAPQLPSLAPVENQVLQTAGIESPLQNALTEADGLISDLAQHQTLPNSQQLDEISNSILPAVQEGEAELDQEFNALPNPASLQDFGELSAYLELKMNLVDAETKAKHGEIEIMKLVDPDQPEVTRRLATWNR